MLEISVTQISDKEFSIKLYKRESGVITVLENRISNSKEGADKIVWRLIKDYGLEVTA